MESQELPNRWDRKKFFFKGTNMLITFFEIKQKGEKSQHLKETRHSIAFPPYYYYYNFLLLLFPNRKTEPQHSMFDAKCICVSRIRIHNSEYLQWFHSWTASNKQVRTHKWGKPTCKPRTHTTTSETFDFCYCNTSRHTELMMSAPRLWASSCYCWWPQLKREVNWLSRSPTGGVRRCSHVAPVWRSWRQDSTNATAVTRDGCWVALSIN